MYAEVAWVLVSSGTQVQRQVTLDPDYLFQTIFPFLMTMIWTRAVFLFVSFSVPIYLSQFSCLYLYDTVTWFRTVWRPTENERGFFKCKYNITATSLAFLSFFKKFVKYILFALTSMIYMFIKPHKQKFAALCKMWEFLSCLVLKDFIFLCPVDMIVPIQRF